MEEFIVCREALIDVPLSGDTWQLFYNSADYTSDTYNDPAKNYFSELVSELRRS